MSRNYASSTLFDWLRKKFKIDKPHALPWGGWDIWGKELKQNRPFAYFMTETLPDWLETPAKYIIDPIENGIYYLRLRFVYKTHWMHTDLAPGKWHEFDRRILHGLFTELVNFVELELAQTNVAWSNKENAEKYNAPWWIKYRSLRWKRWRCPEAGIDHQKWSMTLTMSDTDPTLTAQAIAAYDTMKLYVWWKYVRPTRKDEWDEVGLRDFWAEMDKKYGDHWLIGGKKKLNKQEEQTYRQLSDAVHKLEEDRLLEDEKAMIELIKIRKNLWT